MAQRKRILDHFCVVLSDGVNEPKIIERWPIDDAASPYELPPALPYFVTETSSSTGFHKIAIKKSWFSRGAKSASPKFDLPTGPAEKSGSRFYPFALTDKIIDTCAGASGERIYGASLLRLSDSSAIANVQPMEALVFLSRFPFFSLLHDLLISIHHLSRPGIESTSGSHGHSKTQQRRRTPGGEGSISLPFADSSEVFLEVVFGKGGHGLNFSNGGAKRNGGSGLIVVESKGQALVAGVSVGDELVLINGEPVKSGVQNHEIKQKITDSMGADNGKIAITFRTDLVGAEKLRNICGDYSICVRHYPLGADIPDLSADSQSPRISLHRLDNIIPFIMNEVRLPSSGETLDIDLGPGPRRVRFVRWSTGALPRVEDASFAILWRFLSVDTVIQIIEALIMEQRVVLIADDVAILTPIAESILSFLFPFSWTHVYIPLLPAELLMYLEAPVPFFVGISSSYLTLDVVASVVDDKEGGPVCVFLDSNTLTGRERNQSTQATPQIPEILREQLAHCLQTATGSSSTSARATIGVHPLYGPVSSLAAISCSASVALRRTRSLSQKQAHRRRLEAISDGGKEHAIEAHGIQTEEREARGDHSYDLDLDAPRFFFVNLWAELLLPYSDFLQPYVSSKSEKGKHKRESRKGGGDKKRVDDRNVHCFNSASFLAVSPPTWRPFLQALLGTNLFQAFNHQACEAELSHSRKTKRSVDFFQKLTRAKTLTQMRTMVQDSLSSIDGSQSSDSALLQIAEQKKIYFSYTTFPSLNRKAMSTSTHDSPVNVDDSFPLHQTQLKLSEASVSIESTLEPINTITSAAERAKSSEESASLDTISLAEETRVKQRSGSVDHNSSTAPIDPSYWLAQHKENFRKLLSEGPVVNWFEGISRQEGGESDGEDKDHNSDDDEKQPFSSWSIPEKSNTSPVAEFDLIVSSAPAEPISSDVKDSTTLTSPEAPSSETRHQRKNSIWNDLFGSSPINDADTSLTSDKVHGDINPGVGADSQQDEGVLSSLYSRFSEVSSDGLVSRHELNYVDANDVILDRCTHPCENSNPENIDQALSGLEDQQSESKGHRMSIWNWGSGAGSLFGPTPARPSFM